MRAYKCHIIIGLLLLSSVKLQAQESHVSKLDSIISEFESFESYDASAYPLGLFTKNRYRAEAEHAEKLLMELGRIEKKDLAETDYISFELLKFVLQSKIDFYTFEMYLNPLLSDSGFHTSLPYMVRPLTNKKEALAYLNKLNALENFVDQHFVNLREGLKKGVSQPLVIFNGYASTYNDHISDDFEQHYYFSPFKNLPSNLSKTESDSILGAAKFTIETIVVPQFKRIKAFFEDEYYPKTRKAIGVNQTPKGKAFYQNRINYYTTSTTHTAQSIHNIGLSEVSRIRKNMETIIKDLNFKGSFSEFFEFLRTDDQFYASSPNELLMYARDIAKRADAQLPRFFKTLARQPYGVAAVPDAIAPKYTGGRYIPAPLNSTTPGYYWVNTYDLKSRTLYTIPALTVHEAVPGHHLQGALNKELGDSIPQFRRDLYLSAYGEGWGLYSEYLAEEMGIYTTPYEHFGKLTYEMWRACRLVVDTGIHAMGWTRDQAVEYLSQNTALSLHEINTETDRYISWPGQALSYKIGELKIRELREKAEKTLGSKFDIRAFHSIILEQGTVTLALLETRINNYINREKDE